MTLKIPLGLVMADVVGLELSPDDIKRLQHPLIGAVILFARNYQSPDQLKKLTASIHGLREPSLPIAVDHEGGRVQRFREGFTAIPPMRTLGEHWQQSTADAESDAKRVAEACGYVIGAELVAHGVDFTFAPVLDLDWGESGVIGDRSFHRSPAIVTALARELMNGMRAAGMANCGKHYPGHGYVRADSHHEIPHDARSLADISADDMMPFSELANELDSVMPAHVIYDQIDSQPAGFSAFWLQQKLRGELAFKGVIFSDDLTMEGASVAGGMVARAEVALAAGCDMVLLCNDPVRCDELLNGLWAAGYRARPETSQHLARMRARPNVSGAALADDARYLAARSIVLAAAAGAGAERVATESSGID